MMVVQVLPARELGPDLRRAWEEIRRGHPALESPHFSSSFIEHVAAVRSGIEVAIVEQDGEIVAFLPFRRGRRGVGMPVAGPLSDLQGAVASPGWECDARKLVRECRLSCLSFSELLATQRPFQPYHVARRECPFMDLSRGFESYRSQRRQAGSDEVREALRKSRKIQREVGPLRFVPHCKDEDLLDVLLGWKEEQLRRRGEVNALAEPWMRPLLTRILREQSEELSGMLSVLFVSDEVVAASMGMRSEGVVAGWVTAYAPRFARYSPGLLLLVELAKAAEAMGIRRIDMGPGGETYKQSFRSEGIPLAAGSVAANPLLQLLRTTSLRAEEWVRSTPLSRPARSLSRRVRIAAASWKNAYHPQPRRRQAGAQDLESR